MNSAQLIKRFKSQSEAARYRVDVFKTKLDEDAAHALIWSLDAFKSAAEIRVLGHVIDSLEGGNTVEQVLEGLIDRVLQGGKYPAQSTSPTSNLMEQYELAVYAELATYLKRYHN
jgi:hypothetical protein